MADSDLTSLMLSAMVETATEQVVAEVDLNEMKYYLNRFINSVPLEDRRAVGMLMIMNNKKHLLRPCAEGTVVNLDAVEPDIVRQMYDLLKFKRE